MSRFVALLVLFVAMCWLGIVFCTELARSDQVKAGSTVELTTMLGLGSGVHIGGGVIVTAAHVVEGVSSLVPMKAAFDCDGTPCGTVKVKVTWVDPINDLATVQLQAFPAKDGPAAIGSSDLACRVPRIGEPIEIVGAPRGVTFVHSWGRVAGVTRELGEKWRDATPIDARILPGNSGGPAFDRHGKVLGIVVGAIVDRNDSDASTGVPVMIDNQAICKHFAAPAS